MVNKLKRNYGAIDPHVHCRGAHLSYKNTIKLTFEEADRQGVEKIFDMPNTPPIICRKDVEERLKLVPASRKDDYFIWIATDDGLTQFYWNDPDRPDN